MRVTLFLTAIAKFLERKQCLNSFIPNFMERRQISSGVSRLLLVVYGRRKKMVEVSLQSRGGQSHTASAVSVPYRSASQD